MPANGFENIEVIDPFVEKGWSPRIQLTLASHEEVDDLERQVGRFPLGYREYVTTLGRGEYCSYIRVQMPSEILEGYVDYRRSLDEHWFWEMSEELISKETATESVNFASTIDGNSLLFHPDTPEQVFVLPRNDDCGYIVGADLYQMIDWLCVSRQHPTGVVGETHTERYFVPYNELAYEHGLIRPAKYS